MSIFDVSIIGVGRLGGALALALSAKGYKVRQLVAKDYISAKKIADLIDPQPEILNLSQIEDLSTDIIFIATQDSEIEAVGELLAKDLVQMPFIFHTSGAKPSSILHELRRLQYEVASFHPLVSISDPIVGAKSFENAYFCLEGDSEAL